MAQQNSFDQLMFFLCQIQHRKTQKNCYPHWLIESGIVKRFFDWWIDWLIDWDFCRLIVWIDWSIFFTLLYRLYIQRCFSVADRFRKENAKEKKLLAIGKKMANRNTIEMCDVHAQRMHRHVCFSFSNKLDRPAPRSGARFTLLHTNVFA